MLIDKAGRKLTYLRISVTDRCNLRCTYCMPEEGIKLLDHNGILSYSQIVDFTKTAVSFGITKVRLTGGEPLVRKEISTLIREIAKIEGITDLSLTTNGQLLAPMAQELKDAGLQRVNISLDTIDKERYMNITRGGNIERVFEGISEAKRVGLSPVKINCVVEQNSSEADATAVAGFAKREGLSVRFIRMMDLKKGEFGIVDGGDGGNCAICNRLRLTATGILKPCLFNDLGFDIKELGAETAIKLAVHNKPAKGGCNSSGNFYNIGG